MPPRLRIFEGDRTAYRIDQIDLSFNQVLPGRRVGVLEIGHEDIGAAVQRIDYHLAVGGAGDLDAAVPKVLRDRRYPPVAVADCLGLGQEIRFQPASSWRWITARRARRRRRSAPNSRS